MTIAQLTFTLPEESTEHLCAVHALRLHGALSDVDSHLRNLLKHDGINSYTAKRLAEEVRLMLCDDLALIGE